MPTFLTMVYTTARKNCAARYVSIVAVVKGCSLLDRLPAAIDLNDPGRNFSIKHRLGYETRTPRADHIYHIMSYISYCYSRSSRSNTMDPIATLMGCSAESVRVEYRSLTRCHMYTIFCRIYTCRVHIQPPEGNMCYIMQMVYTYVRLSPGSMS